MAKFETIFSALTYAVTTALFVAVAFGSASPDGHTQVAHGRVIAGVASVTGA